MARPTVPAQLLGMRPFRVDEDSLRRRLTGRTAVVTGASRGVGRAVAQRCAAAGAHVVLLARDAAALADVAAAIRSRGGSATTLPCDLRDLEAAAAAGRQVVADHGAPALLVSNAGHSIHRDLVDSTHRLHDVTRSTGVNMLGPIAFALPQLSAMARAGDGHLVSVGTVGMVMPGPGWSAYTASKAGFDAWLRSISPELRPGVAVTSIHLPLTRTRMSAPTYRGSRLPSLSAADAASWVCHAAVARPRVVAPWWGRVAGVLTAAAPATADRMAAALWRRSS